MNKKYRKFILTFLGILLIFGINFTKSINAEENESSYVDKINNSILKFIEYDDENYPFVNIDAMLDHNVGLDLITEAEQTNELFLNYKNKELTKLEIINRVKRRFAPTYGNWCGDGHGHATTDRNYPVVDGLDWACKLHDICYDDHGYFNARCDRKFIDALKKLLASNTLNKPGARVYAAAAYAFFSVLRNYGG